MSPVSAIPREVKVEQSVTDYLRDNLFSGANAYADADVGILQEFPSDRDRQTNLDKTYIAVGFTYDTGGTQAELGSSLKRRPYTIEFFVFGLTLEWGRNVALTVKSILDNGTNLLPLKDIGEPGAPVIDQLIIGDDLRSARQITDTPFVWDDYVWLITVTVTDEYFADEV